MLSPLEIASGGALLSASAKAAGGLLAGFVLTILLGRLAIPLLRRVGIQEPVEKGFSEVLRSVQRSKGPVPTMGGLFLVAGSLLPLVLMGNPTSFVLLMGILCLGGFACTGFLDDTLKVRSRGSRALSGRAKLTLQGILALAVAFAIRWREIQGGLPPAIGVPFTSWRFVMNSGTGDVAVVVWLAFAIVALSNAVNLADGLDGLASGLVVFAGLPLAALVGAAAMLPGWSASVGLAVVPGSEELALFAAALIGATLGFLWYNCYPAEVILGDTGSLALGAGLAFLACAARIELLLLVFAAPFVAENLSVILQVGWYKLTHRRVFRCAPVHHHFQFGGLHESKVTVRFWIVGLILGLLGLVWGPLG